MQQARVRRACRSLLSGSGTRIAVGQHSVALLSALRSRRTGIIARPCNAIAIAILAAQMIGIDSLRWVCQSLWLVAGRSRNCGGLVVSEPQQPRAVLIAATSRSHTHNRSGARNRIRPAPLPPLPTRSVLTRLSP